VTTRVLTGDCRAVLRTLPDESVHCVVTSPPYFGLRDYGTAKWEGGEAGCDHSPEKRGGHFATPVSGNQASNTGSGTASSRDCPCGAIRVDSQIGLEPTPDAYVAELVAVFRDVRRVLRRDGTVWLNLGDSYARNGGEPGGGNREMLHMEGRQKRMGSIPDATGLKPKDLIGIPWRVAFALQADGWWLRQDIIWCLSGGAWLYARTASGVGPAMLKDLVRLKPETVDLWTGERWSRVVAWTRRQGRAEAFELVLRSGERIGCTGNHVWPTERGNLPTSDLVAGDVVRTTLLPDGEKTAGWLTDDAFWFAGLYLAEGSRSGETIQVAGHVKESDRLARLRSFIAHYGGSARVYDKGNNRAIHIDSIAAAAVLRTLIGGHTAKDKHLTPAAWLFSNWHLSKLVEGYLHGDGHEDGTRVRLGFCRNYALERDLRCLAARLGATLTLNPATTRNKSGSFPSFRGEWRWNRSGHWNEKDRGEVIAIRRSRARKFWDVTVADEPHLFALASGVLTHNSKPNPMPESVTDRCTKAHEYLFLLTKAERYYFDAAAIAEEATGQEPGNTRPTKAGRAFEDGATEMRYSRNLHEIGARDTRNKRSVWTVATQPFSEWAYDFEAADYVDDRGIPRKWSPGCPIHERDGRLRQECLEAESCDGRAARPAPDSGSADKSPCTSDKCECGISQLSHFATFPPALIEPCILAGCPAKACAKCGAPWVREVEVTPSVSRTTQRMNGDRNYAGRTQFVGATVKTLGFSPSCSCGADTAAGTVLDPFGGAGTTGLVANRLQRNAILVELNPQYAAMARRRITNDGGMFAEAAE
jgi:DNA modification methylase